MLGDAGYYCKANFKAAKAIDANPVIAKNPRRKGKPNKARRKQATVSFLRLSAMW